MATLNRTRGSFMTRSFLCASFGASSEGSSPHCGPPDPILPDLGHLDPGPLLVRAGDRRLDEGHAGHAFEDARGLERGGDLLAATAADRPFERPVQVAERRVEPFGVARGEPEIRLDRAGE